MNYVDLLIILLVVVSVAEGLRRGGAVQFLSYLGMAGGLLLGATVAQQVGKNFHDIVTRTMVSTVALFGTAFLAAAAGRMIGRMISGHLARAKLGPVDAAAGAGISLISTLVVVWLMAGMLASVPLESVSQGIHSSKVVQTLNKTMPPAPAVFSRIRQLLTTAGFPQVFAGLEPSPDGQVPLPDDQLLRSAVTTAGPSTVKITGLGCGGSLSGSGFVAAPGLVVTNAHVVAGIPNPQVQDRKGFHRAVPLVFDPAEDMAVLSVRSLSAPALKLVTSTAPSGQAAAVLGYPGGGPFKAVPAAVIDQIDALGRDIYGRRLASRKVYRLHSEVRPGNSGGPLVNSSGGVLGVVFSASALRSDIGYALTAKDVTPRLALAQRSSQRVGTGPCAA